MEEEWWESIVLETSLCLLDVNGNSSGLVIPVGARAYRNRSTPNDRGVYAIYNSPYDPSPAGYIREKDDADIYFLRVS